MYQRKNNNQNSLKEEVVKRHQRWMDKHAIATQGGKKSKRHWDRENIQASPLKGGKTWQASPRAGEHRQGRENIEASPRTVKHGKRRQGRENISASPRAEKQARVGAKTFQRHQGQKNMQAF